MNMIMLMSEVQRLTQQLAGRVKILEKRYAQPLPELEQEQEVEEFGAKVEGHLKKMGLARVGQQKQDTLKLPGRMDG